MSNTKYGRNRLLLLMIMMSKTLHCCSDSWSFRSLNNRISTVQLICMVIKNCQNKHLKQLGHGLAFQLERLWKNTEILETI